MSVRCEHTKANFKSESNNSWTFRQTKDVLGGQKRLLCKSGPLKPHQKLVVSIL